MIIAFFFHYPSKWTVNVNCIMIAIYYRFLVILARWLAMNIQSVIEKRNVIASRRTRARIECKGNDMSSRSHISLETVFTTQSTIVWLPFWKANNKRVAQLNSNGLIENCPQLIFRMWFCFTLILSFPGTSSLFYCISFCWYCEQVFELL